MQRLDVTQYNLGTSLDNISCIDPRGYGVCNILYPAAKKLYRQPLCMNAAIKLCDALTPGSYVFIITGFVLYPSKCAETDGVIGSMLLARAIINALGGNPVMIVPCECLNAVNALAKYLMLNDRLKIVEFTKDSEKALSQSLELRKRFHPAAVISVEAPGANIHGVYHNAAGEDITALEAKSDVLFKMLYDLKTTNIAIGDLGNEIGMGAIAGHIKKYVPNMGSMECACRCEDGATCAIKTDNLITSTTSDWGAYALNAALSFMTGKTDILPDGEDEDRMLNLAVDNGLRDMDGSKRYAIDGFSNEINKLIISLMKECVLNIKKNEKLFSDKFNDIISKGFFG